MGRAQGLLQEAWELGWARDTESIGEVEQRGLRGLRMKLKVHREDVSAEEVGVSRIDRLQKAEAQKKYSSIDLTVTDMAGPVHPETGWRALEVRGAAAPSSILTSSSPMPLPGIIAAAMSPTDLEDPSAAIRDVVHPLHSWLRKPGLDLWSFPAAIQICVSLG